MWCEGESGVSSLEPVEGVDLNARKLKFKAVKSGPKLDAHMQNANILCAHPTTYGRYQRYCYPGDPHAKNYRRKPESTALCFMLLVPCAYAIGKAGKFSSVRQIRAALAHLRSDLLPCWCPGRAARAPRTHSYLRRRVVKVERTKWQARQGDSSRKLRPSVNAPRDAASGRGARWQVLRATDLVIDPLGTEP